MLAVALLLATSAVATQPREQQQSDRQRRQPPLLHRGGEGFVRGSIGLPNTDAVGGTPDSNLGHQLPMISDSSGAPVLKSGRHRNNLGTVSDTVGGTLPGVVVAPRLKVQADGSIRTPSGRAFVGKVRRVTFSFLWDFSRFHGTDREIRN
eukprot:SAG31_NODE_18786_length_622_cov_1.875717_1_plen_150_part_00